MELTAKTGGREYARDGADGGQQHKGSNFPQGHPSGPGGKGNRSLWPSGTAAQHDSEAPTGLQAENVEAGVLLNWEVPEVDAGGSTNRVMLGTVSATDPENTRLTCGIEEGNAAGLFKIDSGSGGLFYVGTGEDFEPGTSSYDLTVRANDSRQNIQSHVAVNVANVAEATGSAIKSVDYSDPILAGRRLRYAGGWAGWGFELAGSQRGAPEYIDIAEIDPVAALRFKSAERNQAWYDEHPAVVDHAVYGHTDAEIQDDFFLYATGWTTEENPYLLAQVYLGNFENRTSLRMIVRFANAFHNEVRSFPTYLAMGPGSSLAAPGALTP